MTILLMQKIENSLLKRGYKYLGFNKETFSIYFRRYDVGLNDKKSEVLYIHFPNINGQMIYNDEDIIKDIEKYPADEFALRYIKLKNIVY